MKKTPSFILSFVAALSVVHAQEKVDFTKSIKPIFESRCIECHGAKKSKGELRLDSKEALAKGGESKKTVLLDDPDKSEMFRRISLPAGHDDIMPPKGDPLTKEQIEAIHSWIKEGAAWPDGLVLGDSGKKDKPSEFEGLTATKDLAAETNAVQQLAALGVSVRPIAQNMTWKEATVRPQDTNSTAKAIEMLKNIPSLVELNLAGLKLKDEDLANIAGLNNLLKLHLENTPVTDTGARHLKGLTNLRYLNLYNTALTDAGLESLKGMAKLEKLYLWQTKVTDTGAEGLKKAIPAVTINRGEDLKILAKVEDKKEEKKETKPEEKKEEKKDVKPEEKKDVKPEPKKEEKIEEKKEAKTEEKKDAPVEKKEAKPEDKK